MFSWSRQRILNAVITFACVEACYLVATLLCEYALGYSMRQVVTEFMIISSIVIGMQTYVGNAGVVSFGHASFYAIGAYVAALVTIPPVMKTQQGLTSLPSWVLHAQFGVVAALVLAALISAVFGVLTGAVVSRMKVETVGMATMAILVFVYNLINLSDGMTRGSRGLAGVPVMVGDWWIFFISSFIAAVALLYGASPSGLRLQAVREDETAATAVGINPKHEYLIGWSVSAVLVGLGGGLWALHSIAFAPSVFYFNETFLLLSMLVLGGIGSVSGALIGSLIMSVLTELMNGIQNYASTALHIDLLGLVQFAMAALIILVLVFSPRGLTKGAELGSLFRLGSTHGNKGNGGERHEGK